MYSMHNILVQQYEQYQYTLYYTIVKRQQEQPGYLIQNNYLISNHLVNTLFTCYMAPILDSTTTTMSNPHTNAPISLLLNTTNDATSSTAASFKTIFLGQDNVPVSILTIASLTDPTQKKNSCFDSLALMLRNRMEGASISDLSSVVSTELHIDTTTAFVEATAVRDSITAKHYP